MTLSTALPFSTSVSAETLSAEELRKIHAYWRAANYLSVGQIYLLDNPLLREPLTLSQAHAALLWSAAVTLVALMVFGYFKSKATGAAPVRGALQTVLIGSLAAMAAFLIARAFSGA